MKIIILILLSSITFGQNLIIIDSNQVNQVKGRFGIYSEINPIPTFDGKFLVPEDCLYDPDLIQVRNNLLTVKQNAITQNVINLPSSGTIYKDSLYIYNGIVKCRQTHQRTIYPPEQTPALFSFYRENSDTLQWIENEEVKVGWKRVYLGTTYRCLQSHQTLSTWTPTATLGVLWASEAPPTGAWTVGVAYKVGDLVTYQGNTYRCLQAHTSQAGWTPTAVPALWQRL